MGEKNVSSKCFIPKLYGQISTYLLRIQLVCVSLERLKTTGLHGVNAIAHRLDQRQIRELKSSLVLLHEVVVNGDWRVNLSVLVLPLECEMLGISTPVGHVLLKHDPLNGIALVALVLATVVDGDLQLGQAAELLERL